jgi:hypothetical protein
MAHSLTVAFTFAGLRRRLRRRKIAAQVLRHKAFQLLAIALNAQRAILGADAPDLFAIVPL